MGLFLKNQEILGVLQLSNIGPLLNNAYIWNSKEGRGKLNKKPFYIQSGIILVFIGLSFFLTFIDKNWPSKVTNLLQILCFSFVFIFAIGSSIYIGMKNIGTK